MFFFYYYTFFFILRSIFVRYIFCTDIVDGDELDVNESSESDDADEELHENGNETIHAEDKLPPGVMEAFISLEIFDKVWARTQLPAENVMLILKEYEASQIIYKRWVFYINVLSTCLNPIK